MLTAVFTAASILTFWAVFNIARSVTSVLCVHFRGSISESIEYHKFNLLIRGLSMILTIQRDTAVWKLQVCALFQNRQNCGHYCFWNCWNCQNCNDLSLLTIFSWDQSVHHCCPKSKKRTPSLAPKHSSLQCKQQHRAKQKTIQLYNSNKVNIC